MTTAFEAAVRDGLSRPQKTLSPKWLYDAAGSALFDRITAVPEYDLPARERAVMNEALPVVGASLRGAAVAEFGIGSGEKSTALIEAVWPPLYVPIDISADALRGAADGMRARFGGLDVRPAVADFTRPVEMPTAFRAAAKRLGYFPGSTIGNFDDPDAVSFMASAMRTLGEGASFLVGVDLVRDVETMIEAYDDAEGVTAAFNLNLLTRINREAGGAFEPSRFRHEARWNANEGRIEMHLVSGLPQTVRIGSDEIAFEEGESIHTESSHKYTTDGFAGLAHDAGWSVTRLWTDDEETFAVFLLGD